MDYETLIKNEISKTVKTLPENVDVDKSYLFDRLTISLKKTWLTENDIHEIKNIVEKYYNEYERFDIAPDNYKITFIFRRKYIKINQPNLNPSKIDFIISNGIINKTILTYKPD